MLNPSIYLDFADAAYWDPRLTFARAGPASYCDRLGILRYRPANTPRFWTTGKDASPSGLLLELNDTNYLLWSEDFTNAAWMQTGCTITGNSATAPDGNLTADTITANATNANIAQSVTVPVNTNVSFAIFANVAASSFVSLSLSDGTNVVSVWFNLAAGAVGGKNLGAGTLTYQWASIQQWGNGWYRCGVQALTNTITTVTGSVSPCAADRAPPAVGNAALIWGAMLSNNTVNPSTTTRQGSYIGTTTASVARALEYCNLPYARIDPSQFNQNEGTYFVDFIVPPGTWKQFSSLGWGFGASSGDTMQTGITVGQNALGAKLLALQTGLWAGGGAARAGVTTYPTFDFEVPVKVAARYALGQTIGHSVNGGVVASSPTILTVVPALPIGFQVMPFSNYANPSAASAFITRRFMYFPRYLSADEMQQLTA
jgi:hypothetical protein